MSSLLPFPKNEINDSLDLKLDNPKLFILGVYEGEKKREEIRFLTSFKVTEAFAFEASLFIVSLGREIVPKLEALRLSRGDRCIGG